GKSLAPDFVSIENFGDEALFLFLGPVMHQRGTNDANAEPIRRLGGVCPGHFLRIDRLLDQRGALPTILLGPVNSYPAALVELALPAPSIGKLGILVFRRKFLRPIRL